MKRLTAAAIAATMAVLLLNVPRASASEVAASAFRTCHSVETRITVPDGSSASGVVTVNGVNEPFKVDGPGSVEVSIPLDHSLPAADAVVTGTLDGEPLEVRSEYGFGEPCEAEEGQLPDPVPVKPTPPSHGGEADASAEAELPFTGPDWRLGVLGVALIMGGAIVLRAAARVG